MSDKVATTRPRKRFGQHFLHDPHAIDRIIQAFAPEPGQKVVEVGPGRGALTRPLLAALGELDVIELDRDLAAALPGLCNDTRKLRIHNTDALHFDFRTLAPAGGLRVIGNLPYNISTPLIFHLLDQADAIHDMLFMLQREVVDRMAAAPGSKTYGRLSVMVQYICAVEPLFRLKPGAFEPPPRVESAMVRLLPRQEPLHPVEDMKMLARVVSQAFGQRRKTVRNALQSVMTPEQIRAAGIDPGLRAEQLGLAQFAMLANQAHAVSS
jgi:16S rRNA (adenine1518-N6/adenine1519-N6)-dimethyltransferase